MKDKVILRNSNKERYSKILRGDIIYFYILEQLIQSDYVPGEDRLVLGKLYDKTASRIFPDIDFDTDIDYYVDFRSYDYNNKD